MLYKNVLYLYISITVPLYIKFSKIKKKRRKTYKEKYLFTMIYVIS